MKNRALSEATWILGTLAAGWLISLALLPVLSILFAGLLLFTLYFFRDPERVPAGDENTAVSAADGVVTTIDEIEENEPDVKVEIEDEGKLEVEIVDVDIVEVEIVDLYLIISSRS